MGTIEVSNNIADPGNDLSPPDVPEMTQLELSMYSIRYYRS